jgi:NADPH-dependent ferric siderophore reductase
VPTPPTPAQDDAVRPSGVRAFPLSVGVLEVVAAERLTPRMRRLVLTGEGIGDLPVEEPGEILTLIWPAPGSDTIVLPTLRRWHFPDGADEQHARNVTIRALDRARRRVTIDFFLHGDEGLASRWARDATAGDVVGYGGPRVHWCTDPTADWTLLIGDETGLPAIGAIVAQRPAGHRTIAVVEVESGAEQQGLSGPGALDVHWVHRGSRAPGCGTDLLDAVRGLELPAGGRAQVWAAGESAVMRSIREHLRDERGLPRNAMNVLGYWKRTDTRPAS